MTVYSKTNAGRLLAFEQKPGVPEPLRDMLRRVDGKTPYQQLVSRGNDAELFEELFRRKLIQIAPEAWRNSAVLDSGTDSVLANSMCSLPATSQHADNAKPDESHLSLVAAPGSHRNFSKIETIKAQMVGFVRAELPEHADATFAEIDALTNEAQLLCMLNGYINLVNPSGKAGQVHVQQLLLTLAEEDNPRLQAVG